MTCIHIYELLKTIYSTKANNIIRSFVVLLIDFNTVASMSKSIHPIAKSLQNLFEDTGI
jgi:hypothetical protein